MPTYSQSIHVDEPILKRYATGFLRGDVACGAAIWFRPIANNLGVAVWAKQNAILACLRTARFRPRVERRKIDETRGTARSTEYPRFAAGFDLNYLKNFHIYLTTARFAACGQDESRSIGQFADELTSKPALICITRWRQPRPALYALKRSGRLWR